MTNEFPGNSTTAPVVGGVVSMVGAEPPVLPAASEATRQRSMRVLELAISLIAIAAAWLLAAVR